MFHMKCKHCGAELKAGELYCYRCGKAVEPEPTERHCGYCGAKLEPEAAFCWRCGKAAPSMEQPKSAETVHETRAETPVAEAVVSAKINADTKAALKARTEALVLAAQKGDSDSFTELYRLYYQKVFALAKTTVRTEADAEDVLQTTFLKAWNNLGKLKDPSAFSTWIQRITLNQCYSLLRKKHIDISIDEDEEDTEPIQLESDLMLPEAYAERSDLKERLGKIIRELSAVQQQTITLYYFDGLPVENIAWIMDCSVNTVKSRLFLARKSIKTEIEEQERKSGQPFYGIVGLGTIPFGKLLIDQMESSSLQREASSALLQSITEKIANTAAKATQAAAEPVAKTVTGSAAKTATKAAAKAGAKTAAKAATTAISKKVIAGVVAAVLATGAITGGTVMAVKASKKNKPAAEVIAVATATPKSSDGIPYAATAEPWEIQSSPAGTPHVGDVSTQPRQTPQAVQATEPPRRDGLTEEQRQAYTAYLNALEQDRAAIVAYEEYPTSFDNTLDKTPDHVQRAVAIHDLDGDSIPELIYIRDQDSYEFDIELRCLSYREGTLRTYLSCNTLTGEMGNFAYFHCKGDPAIYVRFTEDSVYTDLTGTYSFLYSNQYYVLSGQNADMDFPFLSDEETSDRSAHVYTHNGEEVSKETFEACERELLDRMDTCLILGWMADRSTDCIATTCDEAISYLRNLLNESASPATTAEDTALHAAYTAYREHLVANKADIDSYVWQYEGWTDWYDWEWDEAADSDYALRNDTPDDGTMPRSRPVVLYDLTNDGIPELIYIRFDRSAQLDFNNMSHLVILTYLNGQLITLFDKEWEHIETFEGAAGFQIYAASKNYKLLAHWYDGMTDWSMEIHDVFTEGNTGEWLHTHLLYHEHGYDEDTDREANTYKQGDLEIDQAQYTYFVEKWEEDRGPLLLYSGNMGNADYNESLSMTCDDAIKYLNSKLNTNSADLDPMYRAYYHILLENKAAIEHYEQFNRDWNRLADATYPQPVALRDVCGDDTPELIFLREASREDDLWHEVELVIAAYRNGTATIVYTGSITDKEEHEYYLFQIQGDKHLILYYAPEGHDHTCSVTFSAFEEGADGKLTSHDILSYEYEYDPETRQEFLLSCFSDGRRVGKEELDAELARIRTNMDCVIQHNWAPNRAAPLAQSTPSMTCADMLTYLSNGMR